jgi:hypothetical protein
MKRALLLLLITVSLCVGAQSQPYNNEWIDYNKTYYKFKVATDGLFRIRQATLVSLGIGGANADHFQIWKNGREIPIYTSVQNAAFGPSDYIEFWGERLDGKPDKPLYREPDWQLSDKYNLQTDTTAYFLTINTTGNNFRLSPTVNDIAGNTLLADPYFIATAARFFTDRIHAGRAELVGDSYTFSASYDVGEGFTSNDIGNNGTLSSAIPTPNPYGGPGAPDAILKINAVGNAVNTRYFRASINGDSILSHPANYYEHAKAVQAFPVAKIAGGTANLAIKNVTTGSTIDRMVVAQAEIVYPCQFNFAGSSNYQFELAANAAGNYLEISNFNTGGLAPILYDLTNGKRYVSDITSTPGIIKIALLPSAVSRKLILVNASPGNATDLTYAQQRTFVNYGLPANQGDYLIITNALLTAASGAGDPVEDYRAYRSSGPGGGYVARVYMIDQLIDQFGLGINMHPLSIRNFVRWARDTYNSPIKSVFLIGKGVAYSSFRPSQFQPDMAKLCLVPTFGSPASDNLLTAVGNSSMPLTPIGRLSVVNKGEVTIYLNKVKQYEQVQQSMPGSGIADMAWKKNVVHVTGASDDITASILKAATEGYRRIIEDTFYGGKVYSFNKSSSESVQQLTSNNLASLFNEGMGILTYFGHSSATTLEFNLDNPQSYTNVGKYPVFIVMGCNAGSLFNFNSGRLYAKETISERYVLAQERGSIAFIASTHLGIVHYLDLYNTKFYQSISYRKYGATIGEHMQDAIARMFASSTENDFYARFQCEEFALHGDPAIRFYTYPKPDYVIEESQLKISPSFISIAETSFKVSASFMNIGAAVNKDIIVELRRTYPNQSVDIIRDTVPGTRYLDSLVYELPIVASRDKGQGKISITIDAGQDVDESYETNNTISKDIYIFEDEVRPIYPYNFSIVSSQNPKLIASTANALAVVRSYNMEIDTTELFNSPLKTARSVNSAGGVLEFDPGITFTDSTVYYWRVSPVAATGDTKWNAASFTYIAGSDAGFGQSHLYQHFKSGRNHLVLDSVSRKMTYDSGHHQMFIRSGVFPSSFTQSDGFSINIDDSIKMNSVCGISGLVFNVIDPVTLRPWFNASSGQPGRYGSDPVCGVNRIYNFQFYILDTNKRRKISEFLQLIPDGHYVVVRNISGTDPAGNTYASTWKNDASFLGANTIYDQLVGQGFTEIDSFNRPRAFVFVYRKNRQTEFPSSYTMSEGIYDAITFSVDLFSPNTAGQITSPVFGPAKGWKQFHWRGESSDVLPGDSVSINLYGIDNNGSETLVVPNLKLTDQDYDISSIDALQFPYLKIKMHNADVPNVTPHQLKYWMLTYVPSPEGAIAPNLYFVTKDSVELGEPISVGIAFKNISNLDFDSVKVKFTITDANNVVSIVPVPLQKNLAPGDTIQLNIPIDTRSLSGNNVMFVNFNPDFDQPEQYLFNNYLFKNLYVKGDKMNPLLDVTFDGVHILNKDIVSARPDIVIKLKDNARWLVLDDTSLMTVSVRYPDRSTRTFHFDNNSDTLQFIPAGQAPNENNTASINFKPNFTQDGEYELTVSGKDRVGNKAGAIDYRVAFQVINKAMISNMLNYPNPFTTSTAFVFTLTGREVPQNIRIQVMTITGKIVREITKEELGPLRIGRNITEFKWDGTDQYGQKLANGIYLYRVITNLNGKSLENYKAKSDNTDKYFNNGYGKMYLMR